MPSCWDCAPPSRDHNAKLPRAIRYQFNQGETQTLARNEQEQDVSEGAVAIQSGGDTTIHTGLSASQVKEIIECVSDQIPKFVQIAGALVDERLRGFEEKIVNKFSNDKTADPEVFKDPDFLFAVKQAQTAYARSGSEHLGDTLADLIAERSQVSSNTRASMIINDAVVKVAQLTQEEFSVITLNFVILKTQSKASNYIDLLSFLESYVAPFLDNLPSDEFSYLYLESLGLGKLSIGEIDLSRALGGHYPFLQNIAPIDGLGEVLAHDAWAKLIAAGLIEKVGSNQFRVVFAEEEEFRAATEECGLSTDDVGAIWAASRSGSPTKDAMSEIWTRDSRLHCLFDKWNDSPMKHFQLSAVGVAIGYSNLKRSTDFSAPISNWIK